MVNTPLKEAILRLAPRVQTPGQYIGGELNSVVKDHRQVRGKLCLAFPDTYALGMSHHGLQVLYSIMNDHPEWACERA
ncbi:MAG TPA: B12-binding domain-containing radical SAM protein, partial [Isosphaeraceae bacterium]|nr:B12-binding domain-containing radical SAM protein [Isosphaeraceae bacterium]